MNLLLLSNSSAPGCGYLEHAREPLSEILHDVDELVFLPFALADYEAYTEQVRKAMEPLGISVVGAHGSDPASTIGQAKALFTGGGNTFRLMRAVHALGLLDIIKSRVVNGIPYIGSSAGTNVAAPTLRTTNDMPIVEPPSFESFGFVPFQINPHYLDPDPTSLHQGETREERIIQFLEENDVPVLGMREGTWLRGVDGTLTLGGVNAGARLFQRGKQPLEFATGSNLTFLGRIPTRFDSPQQRSSKA